MPFFGVPIRNGLPIGLGSSAGFGVQPFDPSYLFAAGEQGFLYDPSDLSTLFQDSAGTTPVTGVEQVVGLMLDKSKGLVLGPELVTNGDFSGGTTGWTAYQSTLSVVGGKLRATALAGAPGSSQPVSVVNGKTYEVTFEIDVGTVGGGSYFVGNTLFGGIFSIPSSGTYTFNLISGTTNAAYLFYIHRNSGASAGQYFDIDNVSIKELAGNHATSTGAARPTLSARVNLLLATTTLATQNVTTVATTHTLSFSGAGSITLSGTATGTFSAGTHSVVCTAGTLTLTVTGTVTNADLRPTNDGVGIPTYQHVNTATDYDSSGFPLYLSFGGTQAMSTGSIDFETVTSDGQARRNLLTFPTAFDDAAWTKTRSSITANATNDPQGFMTADKLVEDTTASATHQIQRSVSYTSNTVYTRSLYAKAAERTGFRFQFPSAAFTGSLNAYFDLATGTVASTSTGVTASITPVGNGWYRCSATATATTTASGTEISCGLTITPNNPTYTGDGTSGIYIWGAQLETGSTATAFQNIGTDKMSVFAGARKLSDAAQAVVAELSATIASNNGTFLLSAPDGATQTYGWDSKGTSQVDAVASSLAAPQTNVLTGIADIAGDSCIIRVNGTDADTETGDQGTGNYGNYPLYIGARNLASSFLNGRIYSLIGVGSAVSAGNISATESWVNGKTKAY